MVEIESRMNLQEAMGISVVVVHVKTSRMTDDGLQGLLSLFLLRLRFALRFGRFGRHVVKVRLAGATLRS